MLSQKDKEGRKSVIAYGSKTLNKHQKNYCATKKELLAVIHFVSEYRPYLWGRKFEILTDCRAVQWLQNFKDPNGQLARWLSILAEFEFTVCHRPGVANSNADALSRRHAGAENCPSCAIEIGKLKMIQFTSTLVPSIREAQKDDPDISQIRIWLESRHDPPSVAELATKSKDLKKMVAWWKDLIVEDNLVKILSSKEDPRTIIPRTWREEVLRQVHDVPQAGHLGVKKTLRRVRARFLWPSLRTDVERYVASCVHCQQIKGNATRELLQPLVSSAFNELLSCDLVGPISESKSGNNYIVTMIDHFSKWTECIPIPDKSSGTVVQSVVDNWFCRYGTPGTILTDQGTEFEKEFRDSLIKTFKIKKVRTTPFHPQTNGALERYHRTLRQILQTLTDSFDENWDLKIPMAMFAYRSSVHATTDHEPYEILFGKQMEIPISRSLHSGQPDIDELEEILIENNDERLRIARDVWKMSARARTAFEFQYNKKAKTSKPLMEGDLVMVLDSVLKPGEMAKFHRKWKGPFKIERQTGTVTYEISDLERGTKKIIHRNRLKPCHEDTRLLIKRKGVNNRESLHIRPLDRNVVPEISNVAAMEEI